MKQGTKSDEAQTTYLNQTWGATDTEQKGNGTKGRLHARHQIKWKLNDTKHEKQKETKYKEQNMRNRMKGNLQNKMVQNRTQGTNRTRETG